MGRHAGFLTAASAAWRDDKDCGPHLICAGTPILHQQFIDDVKRTMDKHNPLHRRGVGGVSTADGKSLVESIVGSDKIERDAWQCEAVGLRPEPSL
jgi:6-phosphofructokinase 1